MYYSLYYRKGTHITGEGGDMLVIASGSFDHVVGFLKELYEYCEGSSWLVDMVDVYVHESFEIDKRVKLSDLQVNAMATGVYESGGAPVGYTVLDMNEDYPFDGEGVQ